MQFFQNISEFSEFQNLRILIKIPENPVLLILRILILVKFKENSGIQKLFRTQNCHFQEIKNILSKPLSPILGDLTPFRKKSCHRCEEAWTDQPHWKTKTIRQKTFIFHLCSKIKLKTVRATVEVNKNLK